jgi:hypothetical protein
LFDTLLSSNDTTTRTFISNLLANTSTAIDAQTMYRHNALSGVLCAGFLPTFCHFRSLATSPGSSRAFYSGRESLRALQ